MLHTGKKKGSGHVAALAHRATLLPALDLLAAAVVLAIAEAHEELLRKY